MKKFASFVLSVLLALTFCIPAAAAEDYGVIYDETGQLGSEPLRYAGEVTLPALTERYGVDLRVDILTESDYDTVLDAAEGIYEEYEYGYGKYHSGITLTLLLTPCEDAYTMAADDWCVYLGGTDENLLYGDWLYDLTKAVDYAPLVMDFTLFGDVTGLDYWGDPDSWEPTGDDWWVPPTEEGLADTCWVCDGWSLNLLGGGGDPNCAGIAELYCQFEDGQEYQLLYSGVWRMVDDCLQLIVSTGAGNLPSDASGVFPVLIDPSGDYLHIQQDRDNGMRPPFFDNDMSSMELIRSYG